MTLFRLVLITLGLLFFVGWLGACSVEDDPVTPPVTGDTTPPVVLATAPQAGIGGVDRHEPLEIYFSEPMDPVTLTGNITVSGGAILEFNWDSPRMLSIRHDAFAEGDTVTLAVGTGLADLAGNTLAADHSVWFRTTSSTELVMMEVSPADGSVGTPTNTGVLLRFSEYVDLAQVESWVFLSDSIAVTADQALLPFTVRRLHYNTFLLTPDSALPDESLIHVTISDQLTANLGQTLAEPLIVNFTTGTAQDAVPPEVVAVDPPNGTMDVSPGQGYVRVTFSEPINRLRETGHNLAWEVMVLRAEGYVAGWNGDFTQLTIGLPADLSGGTTLDLTWAFLEDMAGVQNPDPYHYQVKVAGTPDYLPYAGGERFDDWTEEDSGEIPLAGAYSDARTPRHVRIDAQGGGVYREDVYFNANPGADPFAGVIVAWDAYKKTGDALLWLGWRDADADTSRDLVTPLEVLPPAPGTWNASTVVTVAGAQVYTLELTGQLLDPQDYWTEYPGEYGPVGVTVKDAWIAVLDYEMKVDGTLALAGRDTVVYAQNFGRVKAVRYQEDIAEGVWRRGTTWREPYRDPLRILSTR